MSLDLIRVEKNLEYEVDNRMNVQYYISYYQNYMTVVFKLVKFYRNQNVLSHTGLLSVGPAAVPRTQVRFVPTALTEHLASSARERGLKVR